MIKDPNPSQEPPQPPKFQQSVIILQEGSWWFQTWQIFMKLETYAYCHQMNTSKMWSRTPAPVRNLHDLLNSSRVSSFFRRVLDGFKHDGFLWNFKLKLIVIKWTHQNGQSQLGQIQLCQTQLGQTKLVLLFTLFYTYQLLNHWLD